MTTLRGLSAFVVISFALGCGSTPAPDAAAAAPAPAAAAPSLKAPEKRADEIIADLKKREAEQAMIGHRAATNVPVVTEVSPQARPGSRQQGPTPFGGFPAGPPPGGTNESDANYWRQEFSIAQARLISSTQKMEQARQRMNDAQSQSSNPNQSIAKMGQDAYARAQQEFSAAQSAMYQDQSAVDAARSNAMRAGVPASMLR
jgi:hypothetical protein